MGISAGALGLGDLLGAGGLGALFSGGADAAAAGGAAALGADAAVGAPLDILAGGAAEGTALTGAGGAATGALASGLATEPTFASSALGSFAPGLDTSAGGLGLDLAGGASGALGYAPTAGTAAAPGAATTPGALPSAITAGTPAGAGAQSVSLAPGVSLGGAAPVDATSAAAAPDFATAAAPTQNAISTGAFDPQGANFTNFAGASGGSDPSILAANAPSPLDTAAYPAGPIGAPGATPGLDQSLLASSGTGGGIAAPGAAAPAGASDIVNIAGAGPGATAGTAPAAASGGGFNLNSLLTGAENSITKNPLGLALGAGGLGYALYNGQKQDAAVNALNSQANAASTEGATLTNYLNTGTLPAGLQASVDQATASAIANAKANAAAQGLPTDPTQNTALAATIASIQQQGPIIAAQIGETLAQTGASYAGLSGQLYTALAGIDQTQTQSIGKAIASMAAALNTGGTKIQIGGTTA